MKYMGALPFHPFSDCPLLFYNGSSITMSNNILRFGGRVMDCTSLMKGINIHCMYKTIVMFAVNAVRLDCLL